MSMPRWARWAIFAVGLAVSTIPAIRDARKCQGFDARAYIGAGLNVDRGKPIYSDEGFTLKFKNAAGESGEAYMPPFLYHPAIAWAYQGLLRASGSVWSTVVRVTNIADYLFLSAGVIALLFAIGWPEWKVGLAQAALWWTLMFPFPLLFGNVGPVMAGLSLLGAAALARGRPVPAGIAFGLAALFKPTMWLIAAALMLVWRPATRREKAALFAAWFGLFLLATLALAAGPGIGSMGDYVAMLARTGKRAWCLAYYDASLGATVLRAITPWRADYHDMVVYGFNPVAASVGKWRHENLALMQGVNVAGLLAMAAVVAWRRKDLEKEPLALAGLAAVAGFLFQPANWPHNYGMIAMAPAAVFFMLRDRGGATDAEGARRIRRMAWESAILYLLILWPIMHALIFWSIWTPGQTPAEPGPSELTRWHIARMLDSLPTLWLMGIAGLVFGAAYQSSVVSRQSPESSGQSPVASGQ